MKKFIYFCFLLLLFGHNAMGQIDLSDAYLDTIINEEFLGAGRCWDTVNFVEARTKRPIWICYHPEINPCAITTTNYYGQILHPAHTVFADSVLLIVSEYSSTHLQCGVDYYFPTWTSCNQCGQGTYHYLSGTLGSTLATYGFGYYEIRCKQPIHKGVHTSFWLYGDGPSTYEEIDIFECAKFSYVGYDSLRDYNSGIWFNPNSTSYDPVNEPGGAIKFKEDFYRLPDTNNLENWHSFGCEWMPDYVKWYQDGNIVAEYHDKTYIPQHPKRIKVGYNIYADAEPFWHGSDTLVVDYIRHIRLLTDCETDVELRSLTSLQNYAPSVKGSIALGSSNGLVAPTSLNMTLRASESITIDQPLELPLGAVMTMIVQECPLMQTNENEEKNE